MSHLRSSLLRRRLGGAADSPSILYWLALLPGAAAWGTVFAAPLVSLAISAVWGAGNGGTGGAVHWLASMARSAGLAGSIALAAVVLGFVPGRLIGTLETFSPSGRRRQAALFLAVLAPLLLPSYVLYYAWSLPLSPTTGIGGYLSQRPELARLVAGASSSIVVAVWHWPLAALILAQGWRGIDSQALEAARLEAGAWRRFSAIVLPLLARPILLALGTCFVLAVSEFTTFHLAGIRTIGTQLAVLYEQTASDQAVARAAWPMVIPAAALVAALLTSPLLRGEAPGTVMGDGTSPRRRSARPVEWLVLAVLLGLSLAGPAVLFVANFREAAPLRQYLALHSDELAWSGWIGLAAACLALLCAFSAIGTGTLGGRRSAAGRAGGAAMGALSAAMHVTILLAAFLPPALVGSALLRLAVNLPPALCQSWVIVSAGLTMRFSAVALIVLRFAAGGASRQLSEMAAVDGASRTQAWLHVHLPLFWPLPVGAMLLVVMLSLTEVPATMMLLPAGLPNFAQRLLNQMHYARDQQVIASCIVLMASYLILAVAAVAILRLLPVRKAAVAAGLMAIALCMPGCDHSQQGSQPKVLGSFGRTGGGEGEMVYPRAIDILPDGSLYVADKTGRIQHLSATGQFLDGWTMPLTEAGKPTGITIGPDGHLYAADTHYHRVVVFDLHGRIVRQLGRFGRENGCFIYPTDVAFAPDGRMFVSEYGGNDRISVFSPDGQFIRSFGSFGSGQGELSRPAAMAVDARRKRLYVADACNHRIAAYDLDCNLIGYCGSPGTGQGQLRYPYGLALLSSGDLLVCEFGNNRVQVFSPEGKGLKVLGRPGRQLGELAFPWGVVVDGQRRAYIVDAGNNRVQIWQL